MLKSNIVTSTAGAIPPVQPSDLWDISMCAKELRMGRSTWTNGVKSGKYPQPIRLSPKRPVWRKSDVLAFIATL